MRCKQGDLAIIVRSGAGNEGKIVTCVRFRGEGNKREADGTIQRVAALWEVDQWLPSNAADGSRTNIVRDAWMRPIRRPPDDCKDETLQWLPVPAREEMV